MLLYKSTFRLKLVRIINLLFFLFFCFKANASDSFKKYLSLLNTIDKAEGRAVVYLSSGYFTYSINHKSYLINTDPKTADTKKIAVTFKYSNGSITSLKIEFLPAIHIAMLSKKCVSLKVDSLTFDKDGDRIHDKCYFSWDNPACTSPNTDQLLDILNPNLDYSDMFTGNLFQTQIKFISSNKDGNATASQPFIYRVLFNDPANTGLLVSLKQGAQWIISDKQTETASNLVTFNAASYVNFKRIDYNLLEKTLDVKLDDANFNLQSGHFETSNFALNIENNTSLSIGGISFSQEGSNYELHYSGATLSGNVSAGSSLTLSNKTLSSLVFDNGSHVGLLGLDIDIANNSLNVSFEAGSIFNIHLLSGNLPIGDDGSITLDKSTLDLDLAAHYSKGDNFNTIGSIITTDLNIVAGKIYFNGNQNPILVQRGKISAKNIIVNSQTYPYLIGVFDFVQLACDYNSELSVKNSITFNLQSGTTITFRDRNFPFTLLANQKYPIGRFNADIKFENFKNHKLGGLEIGNGRANGNFRLIQEERCLVDSLSLSGDFYLNFNVQNTPFKGRGSFFLRDGSLQYVDDAPELNAIVSFSIAKGQNYNAIEIQGNYDNVNNRYIEVDRVTQYPVNIAMKLASDISIPETKVSFNKNLITIDPVSIAISANLTIPGGVGERDYPSGQINGDSGDGNQEVARYDCVDPLGVMHFYLHPVDFNNPYVATAKVSITSTGEHNIVINLSNLALDRPLDYETVGCKGPLSAVIAIVSGALSGVICGPCALPVAVIAYFKVGDLVDGIIQGKIYSFMQDFNKTVVIKAR